MHTESLGTIEIGLYVSESNSKKGAIYMSTCVRAHLRACFTVSRSCDSGLRYNSPLSMEILNRTKQQYISQNYVILCTTIALYAICLGEGL